MPSFVEGNGPPGLNVLFQSPMLLNQDKMVLCHIHHILKVKLRSMDIDGVGPGTILTLFFKL
eukprot:9772596-Heterocapsa_arctica.AAC.1